MKTASRPHDGHLDRGRPSVGQSRTLDENPDEIGFVPIADRPRHRSECLDGPRPCPLVGCVHNNYLNVTGTGHIQIAHGKRLPEDMPPEESCSLDVADRGPQTLSTVGDVMGLTRERIRQIENKILDKIRKNIAQRKNDLGDWKPG